MSPRGGSRLNSGLQESAGSRTHSIKLYMTAAEYEIVTQLAEQWTVPKATAAFGIFATGMRKVVKGAGINPTPEKLALAASRMIAKAGG